MVAKNDGPVVIAEPNSAALKISQDTPDAGPPKLSVSGPAVIKQGDIFSLTVDVARAERTYGAPLQVLYDPDIFDFMSAREGSFLGRNQQRTLFTSHVDTQAGLVHVANSQLGKSDGASGTGTLVELVFRARRPGQTRVGIDNVELIDAEGRLLPVVTQGLFLRLTEKL